MAHAHSNSQNNKETVRINAGGDTEVHPATFHDFLRNKGLESARAIVGGGRPPSEVSLSSTSDLGSERHVSNHLEGIPFYGTRGDIAGPESSNKLIGNKRSNSDSFKMSSRDKFSQGLADSQDGPLLTKLLRYSGGERPRHPQDEETSLCMHQMGQISASFISQSSPGGRADTNTSKWDRATAVNAGLNLQYPPHSGQVMPFGYQAQSNRFKDMNTGPSLMLQTASDEGSRTGVKGSGVLNSISAPGAISGTGRQPAGVLIRSGKQKPGVYISEPESSTTPRLTQELSQHGTEYAGHQMTIFYGGQAHVFDNVHPNKADVIMALAGSNGGSWSTTYTPNSTARPSTGEKRIPSNDDDTGNTILRDLHARSSNKVDSHGCIGSGD